MKLERLDKDSETFDIEYQKREKTLGKCGGYWICSNDQCKHEMTSFLYNFEYHIPEDCPKCQAGKMIEDETQRSFPPKVYVIDGNKQKNWEQGLSPMQQASVLLGEADPY